MSLEFYFCKNTYSTYGACPLLSPVANLLTVRLHDKDYGPAVAEIDITANLRSPTRKSRPTLEGLFDQFHAYIESLPSITFRRTKNRVEISYLSEHFSSDDDKQEVATPQNLQLAAAEVADALTLLRKRIKPTDQFDVEQFLTDATATLTESITSQNEWDTIVERGRAIEKARRDAKSPMEQLDIDWSEYHPEARGLLDDPFYWDCVDDFAPHGNDTGADLLDLFKDWNRTNRLKSPVTFLKELLSDWGIEPIDWAEVDPSAVRRLDQDSPISLSVCNESAVALAFAAIKLRAKCPIKVANMGLSALDRMEILYADSDMPDEVRSAWQSALKLLRIKLM